MRAATVLTSITDADGKDHPYSITPIAPGGDQAAYRVIRSDAKRGGDYRTSLDRKGHWRCACEDHTIRHRQCKHIGEIRRLFQEVEVMAAKAAKATETKTTEAPNNGAPVNAEAVPNTPACPKVNRAIHSVCKILRAEGISKTRENTSGAARFKFRGIDDVMNALAGPLVDSGLFILPRVISRELTERTAKSGGQLFYVVVDVEYELVSVEDGSSRVVQFRGEAMDSSDKATNKAMSAAYKYMAIQTFCIPTEGDPDADAATHEVAPQRPQATPVKAPTQLPSAPSAATVADAPDEPNPEHPDEDMVARFSELVDLLKLDPAKVASTLEKNHGTKKFRELTWADAHCALDWLERKLAAKELVA